MILSVLCGCLLPLSFASNYTQVSEMDRVGQCGPGDQVCARAGFKAWKEERGKQGVQRHNAEIQRYANFIKNGGPCPRVARPGSDQFRRLLAPAVMASGCCQRGQASRGSVSGIVSEPIFKRIRQLAGALLNRKIHRWHGAHVTLKGGKLPRNVEIRYTEARHDFGYRGSRGVPVLLAELKVNGRWTHGLGGQNALHLTIGKY